MDIPGAVASITAAINLTKQIRDAVGSVDEAVVALKLAELTNSLADAKIALAEAQEELRAKDTEIARLKDTFARREDTVEVNGYRYRKNAQGRPRGRPYCPRCLEVDGRLMLMHQAPKGAGACTCPQCKHEYHHLAIYVEDPIPRTAETSST